MNKKTIEKIVIMKVKVNKKEWLPCPVCGGLPLLVEAGDGLEMAYCGGAHGGPHTELCTPCEPVGTSRLAWNNLVGLVDGLRGVSQVLDPVQDSVLADGALPERLGSSVLRVFPVAVCNTSDEFCGVACELLDFPDAVAGPVPIRMSKVLVRGALRMYCEHVLELCCGMVVALRAVEPVDVDVDELKGGDGEGV